MSTATISTKTKFVRSVTRGKQDQYLNVCLPTPITKFLNLTAADYLEISKDAENRIILERVDLKK